MGAFCVFAQQLASDEKKLPKEAGEIGLQPKETTVHQKSGNLSYEVHKKESKISLPVEENTLHGKKTKISKKVIIEVTKSKIQWAGAWINGVLCKIGNE